MPLPSTPPCSSAGARLTTVAIVEDVRETEPILAAAAASGRQGRGSSPLRLWPLAQLRPGAAPTTRQQLQQAGCQEGVETE